MWSSAKTAVDRDRSSLVFRFGVRGIVTVGFAATGFF